MDINWKQDRATRNFKEWYAEELAADIRFMKPAFLCTASTYCNDWENPFAEELVKRAGCFTQYQNTFNRSDRIKIIKRSAKAFGIVLF